MVFTYTTSNHNLSYLSPDVWGEYRDSTVIQQRGQKRRWSQSLVNSDHLFIFLRKHNQLLLQICVLRAQLFLNVLGKHLIHCNKLLQLRHPAIELLPSSLASQLSLCLSQKMKTQKTWGSQGRNNNTVWIKKAQDKSLKWTHQRKSTKMTTTVYLYLVFLSPLSPPSHPLYLSFRNIPCSGAVGCWLMWGLFFNVIHLLIEVSLCEGAVHLGGSQGQTRGDKSAT